MKKRIIFWGTGKAARNNIKKIQDLGSYFEILGFIDGLLDSSGQKFLNYSLYMPKELSYLNADYLCILSSFEWEIRKRIYNEKLFSFDKILTLEEAEMINILENEDLEYCYNIFSNGLPDNGGSNESAKGAFLRGKVYNDLKRYYAPLILETRKECFFYSKKTILEPDITPVWMLWLQGHENAPDVVKICVRSVERSLNKKEKLYFLDQSNIADYIDLPEYIQKKWENGFMANAHFADLIRIRLLNIYGGVWIDSTIYVMGKKLPDYIRDSSFFMYKVYPLYGEWDPILYSNWLIKSEPNNKVLQKTEQLLWKIWEQNEIIPDYYLFHIVLKIATEIFPESIEQIDCILREPSQVLIWFLNKEYNKDKFEQIKNMSEIQKLSYHIIDIMNDYERPTYWDYIRKTVDN